MNVDVEVVCSPFCFIFTDCTEPPHLRSLLMCLSLIHHTFLAQDFPNSVRLLGNLTPAFSSFDSDYSSYLFSVNTVIHCLYHVQSVTQYTTFILHNHPSLTLYKIFYIILPTYIYFQYVSLLTTDLVLRKWLRLHLYQLFSLTNNHPVQT